MEIITLDGVQQFQNMNFPAPLAVMGFLAGMAGLALSGFAALAFLFVGSTRWLRRLGALVCVGAVVYFGLLVGFSLASREATLSLGQEKYFCEIDCHLAYSVAGSREVFQDGQRLLYVSLRTRFDESTISPQRPRDVPLTPNPRNMLVTDQQGRFFSPKGSAGIPLSSSLTPSQSYVSEFVFQLPADSSGLRLLLTSSGWEERFLIGDENSFHHKKTYFAVSATKLLGAN